MSLPPSSIREMIAERSGQLRGISELGPERASQILVELASLLSSLNAEIADANYWFNMKKMEALKEHGVAAKAKIFAEASQEWKNWQERVQQGKALEELIRSTKYYLRQAAEEYKL